MLTPGQWPGIAVINGQDIGSLWQQDNDDPVIHDGPFKTSWAHTISPPGSFIFHFSTLPGDEPLNMSFGSDVFVRRLFDEGWRP